MFFCEYFLSLFLPSLLTNCPQTREHAMLVKTAGVKHLVILINKMDDPTVKWDQKRYDYCKDQLTPYLKVTNTPPST